MPPALPLSSSTSQYSALTVVILLVAASGIPDSKNLINIVRVWGALPAGFRMAMATIAQAGAE